MRRRLARAFYKLDRERILVEQKYKCYYCGCELTIKTATMDHVIPRSKTNRLHSSVNCVVACQPCNSKKGDSDKNPEPTWWQKKINEGIANLEERTKQAEFNLSLDQKGGYRKWKKYWKKRGRWKD